MSMKEVDKALVPIKEMTIRTILAMSVATLRDEYGFGKERLQRFINRFMIKTDCMSEGWLTWKDLCDNIEEETGIQITYEDMFDTSKI